MSEASKQFWKPGNMLYPVPAVMVSCARDGEKPNIITVAWSGTVCSDPAMVSVSVRPERYSHGIIEESGEFVINLVTEKLTKACDWCGMLFRMYSRWAERHGFTVETADLLPGDEAGVKSATLFIKGHNAYGFLKSEKGVHRLVRISPFDANARRHTSFSACDIMPEIDDAVEVDINMSDVRVDTYRASGAGGQHINKTSSAVRMTHEPTGIVVQCQNERSQLQNREQCLKMLRAKLFELELEKKEAELAKLEGDQQNIEWGSQIRSYVFQPYTMVKDHRTNHETGNVQAVMDGEIDPFIRAFLNAKANHEF